MNKKIIIPLVVVATLLPAIAFSIDLESNDEYSSIQSLNPHMDKEVSIISSSEKSFTIPELMEASDLVIEGKILNTSPYEKQIDIEHKRPWVFTMTTVQIQDVIKGDVNSQSIRVQLLGGETIDRQVITERLDVKNDDTVLMFLELEPENIYGNNYNLVAQSQSLYLVKDGHAYKYDDERPIPVEEFKNALKTKTGLN